MSPVHQPPIEPRDEDLERLRATYAPAPRDARQRAAFTRAVAARVAHRQRWGWVPVAAATAMAGLAIWLALPGAPAPSAAPAGGDALFALVDEGRRGATDERYLPDDYAVLARDFDL